MKKLTLLLLLASPIHAANLTGYWAGNGGYKLARQDFYPGGASTNTITRNWDGHTAKIFGAKNETVGFVLFLLNSSGSDATSVNVAISSFTGPSGSSIVSTPVLISGVTNYTNRPIEAFYVRYLQIKGMTTLSWDPTEYEARDVPLRFQRPYTVNGSNDGVPTGGTGWTDRRDHDKFYPDILVPYEAMAVSSFTVAASSSQAVWFDIYLSTNLAAGTYNGMITVREGVTVSTTIPVSLLVYNFTLPHTPSLKAIVEMDSYDINYRHQGQHFPPAGGVYRDTRDHYAAFMHRHKFAATTGDDGINDCGQTGKDFPCPEYTARLNASLYSPTSGYANAPGISTGDSVYSIGTYSKWQSNFSTSVVSGSTGFCTHISSWGAYFNSNFPTVRSFLYLTDEPADLTSTNKWSTWMSTDTTCRTSPYTVNSWVTTSALTASVSAATTTMPVTTFTTGNSSTWTLLSTQYQTTGNRQMWMYNSHPPAVGSVFATEDDGIAPQTIFWAMWKKGIQGWYFWESTYWTDTNNGQGDWDLFNNPKTFGLDTSFDSVKGRTGFQYANGDGVLVYPGSDTVHTADSYSFDGPIASWRLKMIRRGIQDGDYLTAAYAINPSSVTAIVSSVIPKVLWENDCFDHADCTYAYGGRSWTNDSNTWELQREALAQTAAPASISTGLKGVFSLKGSVLLK